MRVTVGQLKKLVREAKVKASPEYTAKERVREALQELVADQVVAGAVKDQATLAKYFSDMDMALNALKLIPLEVWSKLAKK